MLGGARMQYHLRQSLASIGAQLFIKPEVFVTFSAKKFDEKTLELIDKPTRDMVKMHLAGYEKFVRRWTGNRISDCMPICGGGLACAFARQGIRIRRHRRTRRI